MELSVTRCILVLPSEDWILPKLITCFHHQPGTNEKIITDKVCEIKRDINNVKDRITVS